MYETTSVMLVQAQPAFGCEGIYGKICSRDGMNMKLCPRRGCRLSLLLVVKKIAAKYVREMG